MSSDPFLSFFSENTDEFFAPPPQNADAPSPESFDSEVDNDAEELDLNWSFDEFFTTYRGTIPVDPGPTPALTYATDSSYENASSQYSLDAPPSVCSNPFEFETRSLVNDGVYTMGEFIHSDMFSDCQAPSIPAVDPVEAQSDNGTPDLLRFVEMTLSDSPTVQQSASHVISSQVEPFKPFSCPQCPFSSARKHNLKTHIKTHNKEESDKFMCNICGRQLTRKHDLTRHYEKVHGDRTSSSTVSIHRFNPMPQINRGKKLTSSAFPDSFLGLNPAAGVPEDIMAWYKELEACIEV